MQVTLTFNNLSADQISLVKELATCIESLGSQTEPIPDKVHPHQIAYLKAFMEKGKDRWERCAGENRGPLRETMQQAAHEYEHMLNIIEGKGGVA